MRRFVTAVTIAFLPWIVPGCGGQDDRSKSAREAIAAVEELRAVVDELESLSAKASDLHYKIISRGEPQGDEDAEFEALQKRVKTLKESAQRSVRTLAPELDRRIGQDPKDAGLLEARSRLRETVGSVDEALEDLDAARAILPRDAALRARRPGLIRRLGRYEEARSACAELLKEDPGHPVALAIDGLCLFALNSFSDAAARLGEAVAKEGRLEPSLAGEVRKYAEVAKTKKAEWDEELAKRAAEAKADDLPRVKLVTSKGDIVVELYENEAPNAVASFIDLCDRKFYDGTLFHRVIPDLWVQGGDPLSKDKNPRNDGSGDAGYKFADEFPAGYRRHFRGSLGLFNGGQKDTNGSQFYILHRPTEQLDGRHVVFGRVTEGMAVVDAIRKGDELKSVEILRKRPHAYRPVY